MTHCAHVASSYELSYINKFYSIPLLFCRFFKSGYICEFMYVARSGKECEYRRGIVTNLYKNTFQILDIVSENNKDVICAS
jgi:hypothetical protein